MKNTDEIKRKNNISGRKHLFSLRKQISRLIFALCVLVSAAWFTILAVNIVSYQRENDKKRLNALEEYAEALDNNIIQLNDVVGNIFPQMLHLTA